MTDHAAGGPRLHHVTEGAPEPSGRVVLAHGFTQTQAAWEPVAARLRARWRLLRVDLPGHGGSDSVRAGLEEAAGLLGAWRGTADPAARAERRAADEALAAGIERDGVAAFLDHWLAGPLFATLPRELAGRQDRLANTPEGLAAALRLLGAGAQAPLWDRLAGLRCPTLVVAGALDAKFAVLAAEMAAAIGPAAHLELVPGAGHAVHLERPAEVAALLEGFLTTHLATRPEAPPPGAAPPGPTAEGRA